MKRNIRLTGDMAEAAMIRDSLRNLSSRVQIKMQDSTGEWQEVRIREGDEGLRFVDLDPKTGKATAIEGTIDFRLYHPEKNNERYFDHLIFFGSLSCVQLVQLAEELMAEAFSIQSGIQQPGHPESDEQWEREKEELAKARDRLDKIARDLVMAVLGKEITIHYGDETARQS